MLFEFLLAGHGSELQGMREGLFNFSLFKIIFLPIILIFPMKTLLKINKNYFINFLEHQKFIKKIIILIKYISTKIIIFCLIFLFIIGSKMNFYYFSLIKPLEKYFKISRKCNNFILPSFMREENSLSHLIIFLELFGLENNFY